MLKKVFFMVAFVAISASSVDAQIAFGVRAGLSRPTLSVSVEGEGDDSSNGSFGLEAGPVLYYTIKDNWYLNSGIMLSLKSFNLEGSRNTKYYLDVPLYLGYNIPIGSSSFSLYGQAGPFVGYMISETYESASKPLNAGLGAMFGVNLHRFKIELGYQAGLLNIWDSSYNSSLGVSGYNISAHLSSLFFGVSYVF